MEAIVDVVVELVCVSCGGSAEIAATELLVQMESDSDSSAVLVFDCPCCGDIGVVEICLCTVAALLLAGASPVHGLTGVSSGSGPSPGDVPFTAQDLRTWRKVLRDLDSVAPWE
jgi:hypothetical protein